MTKQSPYGQFAVYSYDKYQALFPNAVPAARYEKLDDAKSHADSVTYKMVVVDMQSESSGFVYMNEQAPTSSPWTVRRVTVCVDETKTIEEFMITTQGGAEFALDDVWVYNLNGEWIKGIGYKHATVETMYVAHNSEHGYLFLDKDLWRYTQDKTKATKNGKSEWDDIAKQLTHRFKLVAI